MSPIPQTVPDGFPFESPPNPQVDAEPGITLHGGSAGGEAILAEVVQAKVTAIDTSLSSLGDRLTEVERGWTPIDSGDCTGLASFTVDLTQGGEFPAGTFSSVRMRLVGDVNPGAGAGHIGIRLNGDSTSIYRRHYRATESDGTPVTSQSATGTAWLVGRWGEAGGCNLIFTMFRTDVSGLVNYQTSAFQQVSAGNGIDTIGGGRLEANRLPTSITAFPTNGASAFGNADNHFWVEGYRD